VAFYRDVLGATVLREDEPTFLRLGNIWITINGGGGGPTRPLLMSPKSFGLADLANGRQHVT